jgi:hypothetical protein
VDGFLVEAHRFEVVKEDLLANFVEPVGNDNSGEAAIGEKSGGSYVGLDAGGKHLAGTSRVFLAVRTPFELGILAASHCGFLTDSWKKICPSGDERDAGDAAVGVGAVWALGFWWPGQASRSAVGCCGVADQQWLARHNRQEGRGWLGLEGAAELNSWWPVSGE